MKLFWRWTGTIFFAIAFFFLVLTGIGTSLPIDHHASCSAEFNKPARFLFQEIADDAGSVRWRHDIASAVLVSGNGPTAVWRETDPHGNTTTYRTTAYLDGNYLVRTIDYVPGLPFAGAWAYRLSFAPDTLRRLSVATYRAAGPTRVTITENGRIYNPFFRFLSRYVFGYTQRMQTYLTDLATELQEKVQFSCEVDG